MSELQPPAEGQMNGGGSGALVSIPADVVVITPPKRQRRPSVRLGDIGDQHTFDNPQRRTKQHQQWKFNSKDPKSSKTRPLVNPTTTAAAAVGDGVPITGEYQGTIDVGEDRNVHLCFSLFHLPKFLNYDQQWRRLLLLEALF
ncbi:hypothetical protein L6452_08287 [Arctium lappa]|uniref:Uncharacterized protein n=1 Tax=Arctium lappa TaxID=4217 RepID=A0ACB9DHA8_ARCLA|nr:hypothetical protein L6452_08287 [Arctium lappa]